MAEQLLRVFILVMCVVALWFSVKTAKSFRTYRRLSSHVTASAVRWEVEKKREDQYLLKASYTYLVQGKKYTGNHLFSSFPFRNRYAADEEILQRKEKKWNVWYFSENPSFSSLENYLPVKQLVYTLLLWGLVVYFWVLRRRVRA